MRRRALAGFMVMVSSAAALVGCSLDEPSASETASKIIAAYSGEHSVDIVTSVPADSTSDLAELSDLVLSGDITDVLVGRTCGDSTSIILVLDGVDTEGRSVRANVELWPNDDTTADDAAAAIPSRTTFVGYLVPADNQAPECGSIAPADDALYQPATEQGVVLSNLGEDRANTVEIVWPLLGFTSNVSSLEEALPGGPAIGVP